MNKTQEALKLALECLDGVWRGKYNGNAEEAITAIREALAEQPAQQPNRRKGAHWTEDYPDSPVLDDFPIATQPSKPSYEELERIADDLQALCDKQAIRLGKLEAQQQEPLFWYRPCSNGMYEGPIHQAQIQRIRKESGAWHPLYTSPQPASKPWVGLEPQDFTGVIKGDAFECGAYWANNILREKNT